MTRRRSIRDVQVNRRYGALSSRNRLRIHGLLQVVLSFAQLAESDKQGEEAQRRGRHHAALVAAVVCKTSGKTEQAYCRSICAKLLRFSDLTETQSWNDFRMRREDLPKLPRALQNPKTTKLSNGSAFPGELCFSFSYVA